jgi:hypothetical protein
MNLNLITGQQRAARPSAAHTGVAAFAPASSPLAKWAGRLLATLGTSLSLLAVATPTAMAAGLNDTGITNCADGTTLNAACSSVAGTYPRQDAVTGRDANAVSKTGGGAAGFDFTKIGSNGAMLADSATSWDCISDNVTGLMWEVKLPAGSGLRSMNYTYSWFKNAQGLSNGGVCQTVGHCDTEKYVADVNAATLCSHNDWRMPTTLELNGLVHYGRLNPTIDINYFPNTTSTNWWAANHMVGDSGYAWVVSFINGGSALAPVTAKQSVRLVRVAQ